ncbi:MAG: peptidylprolyl isomerase [Bdellovibrionota bacterium]
MSDETTPPSAENPGIAPPTGAPAQEQPQEASPFDISGRQDFGWILASLAIVVILGAGALVFTGKLGSFGKLPESAIARVGKKDVPFEAFTHWTASLPPSVQAQLGKPEARHKLLDHYLDRIAMLAYAEEKGLLETETFKKEQALQEEFLITRAFIDDALKSTMVPELLRSYYIENKKRYPLPFEDKSQQPRLIDDYNRHIVSTMADKPLEQGELQRAKDPDAEIQAQLVSDGKEILRITREELELEVASYSEAGQIRAAIPDVYQSYLQELLRRKTIALMARSRNYADREDVKRALQEYTPHLVGRVLAQDSLGDMSAAIQKELQEHPERYERKWMKGAHILVKVPPSASDEEVAKAQERIEAIYKEATAPGADFAKIAKKKSEDEGSAPSGGGLGEFAEGTIPKPLAQAAFALQEGEVSQPVRSLFGFHVIKALSAPKGEMRQPAARIMARRYLLEEATKKRAAEIKQQMGIRVNEERLASWQPPQPGEEPGGPFALPPETPQDAGAPAETGQ